MKLLTLSVLSLFVFSANSYASNLCRKEAHQIVMENASPSDNGTFPIFAQELAAGATYKGTVGQLGPYNQDVFVYVASATMHSGWFQEGFAISKDCTLVEQVMLHAE